MYFSVKETAHILGVTPLTLRNWDKNGKFKAQRHPMNNYRMYKLSAIQELISDIEGGTTKSNAEKRVRQLTVKHLE